MPIFETFCHRHPSFECHSPQLIYHRGMREEFEQLIGNKPTNEYWWQGKYPSRFENI